jgi:type I restriction enzyme S subunit
MNAQFTLPEREYKETEIGLLPEDWRVVRLGDVVETYSGGTPKRDRKNYWNGNIPWAKSGELGDSKIREVGESITKEGLENSSAKYVKVGDLLVAMYGATAGKVGLAQFEFTINQAICGIRPNEFFHSEFYFYYFMHIREKLLAQRFGGAQPNISQQIIRNLKIPMPLLPEQKKMACILSTIQSAKERTDDVINSLKELKHLFTYGVIGLKDTNKIRLKETEIGQVPENWEITPSNRVFVHITDGTHDTPPKKDNGFALVKSKQIKNGGIDWKSIDYFISEEDYAFVNKRSRVDKFDLLFSMIGTLGEVALIREEPNFAIKNVGLFKTGGNSTIAKYCLYWLQSDKVKKYVISNASGTTQKYVTLAKLRNFPILYPNETVQRQIVLILSSVDAAIDAEEMRQEAINELFKSMLQNLMTAKIRVNNLEVKECPN